MCQCVPLCTNVSHCVPLCAGADDVSQLKELDEEEFRQLCLMVGMATKPFHVKRFQKALGRPSSQIYSQKLLSTTTPSSSSSSSIGIATQTVPPVRQSSNPRPIKSGAPPPGSVAAAPPVSQQRQQVARPPTSSLAVSFHSRHPQLTSPGQDRFKQQHSQPHPQDTPTTNYRVNATVPTSLEKVRIPTEETVSPNLGYQSLEPTQSAKTSSKQLFLPPYLQPDSETKDITSLVDELTPIQAELGPCPFKPSDWDERRAELVRRYAAIYGQGNSKRKHEELSLHEENINMAAFQLCLRDPTLLVRRDELLVLSRKAIKDGGYTFQHGLSKAKSGTLESIPSPSPSSIRKHSVETVSIDDGVAGGYPSGGMSDSLLPLPRNMSREKKLKRVEELEFLITKNKMKQTIKLTALEKARQANDFSMSHHLQAEIESLGNTLANLQEEYSNMKYRLRRSDRYFEKKRKLEEVEGRMAPPTNSAPLSHQPRELEVVPKRIRCIPEFSESEGPREQEHHLSAFYPEIDPPQVREMGVVRPHPLTTSCRVPTDPHHANVGSSNTTVSFSRTYSRVTPSVTSPDTLSSPLHSPPTLPPSQPSQSSASLSDADLQLRPKVTAQVLSQPERCETGTKQGGVNPASKQATNSESLTEHTKDLPSHHLLASINKLATQAAANLRSLPHF